MTVEEHNRAGLAMWSNMRMIRHIIRSGGVFNPIGPKPLWWAESKAPAPKAEHPA